MTGTAYGVLEFLLGKDPTCISHGGCRMRIIAADEAGLAAFGVSSFGTV